MQQPAGKSWTTPEIKAIVVDHVAMLQAELADRTIVKVERNRALQTPTDRSHGSIEPELTFWPSAGCGSR